MKVRPVAALRLSGSVAREVARLGVDRVARGPVPRRVGELDASVLSRLLGARVDAVEPLDGTEGTTSRVRLSLSGDGVPPSVFVKMASREPPVRLLTNMMDLGADEVGFYRDVRPGLGPGYEAPAVLGVDHDPATKRFVIVLEDLAARGCTFGDVCVPLDPDRAGAVLDGLAVLHGRLWRSPLLHAAAPEGGLAWIRAIGSDPLLPLVTAAVRLAARRLTARDPALAPVAGRAILRRYAAVARELDAGPHTVLHGDPHPGNCYFPAAGAGLLDWQAVRRGNPVRDVAYFVVLALDPETRRSSERDLLDRYRDAFAAAGGACLTRAETWTAYRKMAAYPYVAATFTAGLAGLQDAATSTEGLRRAATAIRDLATPAVLETLRADR